MHNQLRLCETEYSFILKSRVFQRQRGSTTLNVRQWRKVYCTPAGKCYQLIIEALKNARIKRLIENILQERGRVIYDSLASKLRQSAEVVVWKGWWHCCSWGYIAGPPNSQQSASGRLCDHSPDRRSKPLATQLGQIQLQLVGKSRLSWEWTWKALQWRWRPKMLFKTAVKPR